MLLRASWAARRRLAFAIPAAVVLSFAAQPVAADSGGDAQSQVNNAQQSLQHAQGQASSEDAALAADQASLASYSAQLNAMQAKVAALDATIAGDTATLDKLNDVLTADKGRLAAYVRQSYENGGSEAALVYIISARDIATAIERKEAIDKVATAVQQLIGRIHGEADQQQQTLAADTAAQAQLKSTEAQVKTQEVLVEVQTEQVQAADAAAHQVVSQAQSHLASAQAALAAELAAQRASNTVFNPIAGSTFTVDTNLTLPSGESAQNINNFLQGTAMAGLGDSFMRAEQEYHVSARYFVAHAILESNWGTSAIAQNKHNLFGFGADDANPYNDAKSFPSFDACIQDVAQFVAQNYLSPSGPYYHGPTLRGMNVDYASDPNWASKIARIAQSIP